MPVFTIQVPDGRKVKIQAEDEAAAISGAQDWVSKNPAQAAPQAGAPPPAAQPQPQGSGNPALDAWNGAIDTLNAGTSAFVNNLPIVGPGLSGIGNNVDAAVNRMLGAQAQTPDAVAAQYATAREQHPVASTVGGIAGAVAPFMVGGQVPAAAKFLGMDASMPLLARTGLSAVTNSAISGADAAARGADPSQIAGAAATGGLAGAIAPGVGDLVQRAVQAPLNAVTSTMQRAATNNALRGAPSSAELKSAASALFDKVDQSGVMVNPNAFSRFVMNTVQNAKRMGIDPTLDPKASAAFKRLIGALQDVQSPGAGPLTLSDLHTLRQIAQGAAQSTEGRDSMFANTIVNGLDDFVRQRGSLGAAGGGGDLLNAISTWARASRVGRLEEAISQGSNMASGAENGIRLKFLGLMRDKKFMAQLSPAEKQAISDVAHGTPGINLARIVGVLGISPTSRAFPLLMGALGGTSGFATMGPMGAAMGAAAAGAGMGVGTLSKMAAERLRVAAAERAAQAVAMPTLPQVPQIAAPNVSSLVQSLVRARYQAASQ